jgi:neutral ceramidase
MPRFLFAAFLFITSIIHAGENWQAGVAKRAITPTEPTWMAGYASRKEPGDRKVTDLWAKALLIQDSSGHRGLVITLDLVGIGREFSDSVCTLLQDELGLGREQIALCTSHTHSGPVVRENLGPLHLFRLPPGQQEVIQNYATNLRRGLLELGKEAAKDLQPARLQWGSGKATFAANRRNNKPETVVPERRRLGTLVGPVDHDVPVLSVRSPEGGLRAVLFGYACHATTTSFQEWSGDYPGFAQIALERDHPGCTALFWAGCGGDQNPLPRRTQEYAETYGENLARAVGDVLAAPMPDLSAKLSTRYQLIPLAFAQIPTQEEIKAKLTHTNPYEAARARHLLQRIKKEGKLGDSYPYPIGCWKLGCQIEGVEFITLGGEVTVEYALRLKKERQGLRTWVAGYSNDIMAYIPSLKVLREGGYEGGGSNAYYGIPSLWADSIEETIVGAAHRISGNP